MLATIQGHAGEAYGIIVREVDWVMSEAQSSRHRWTHGPGLWERRELVTVAVSEPDGLPLSQIRQIFQVKYPTCVTRP